VKEVKDPTRLTRRSLLAAMSVAPAGRLLHGQQAPEATFSTGVNVVNVYATVRDRKGEVVRNLTKDDFLLSEDGRDQVIRYFSQESNLPLTIGLVIDTSGSTQRVLPDEQAASFRFLDQVMRQDKDSAFVMHFDFETELLQDITSSHKLLERALNQLESPNLLRRGGGPWNFPGGRGGRRGGRRGGGTVLYDAVFLAADELMKKQPGRKALILLSDGQDQGSRLSLSQAVEAAQRADTLVYSILFEDPDMVNMGLGRMGGGPDGRQVLDRISRETGGRFFEVTRRMPIDKVFAAIEEDLRNQYSLGYTPQGTGHREGYHRIRLTTRQKGLTVQTREGYYSSSS
jgi:VWFA-related protein